ncbi:MAG: outer membrane protein assembly factor BamD [Alphaproteobacteria bacterium]|nr:outer membrane protein assembly factor BamD [Alphaproteobacteria bacterium]
MRFYPSRKALPLLLPALLLPAFLLLAGCSGDKEKTFVEKPAEELYEEAVAALQEKEYKNAVTAFEEVERQHPYSVWATRAQIMAAFSQYQQLDYDGAVATLDRFIQLHPGNAQISYAYYLRALCFYERIPDVHRDQTFTRNTERALRDVISRYPDTAYARDAVIKLSLVYDQIAGAEMEVGRYYLGRHLYQSALGRFQLVVRDYQTTSHAAEALHRLVECYLALGINKEAQAIAAVLGYNFPGSEWYENSYDLLEGRNLAPKENEDSWIGKVWKKVF